MSQLLLTVLGAIHLCTEPHNTHKTAPKQLSSTLPVVGQNPETLAHQTTALPLSHTLQIKMLLTNSNFLFKADMKSLPLTITCFLVTINPNPFSVYRYPSNTRIYHNRQHVTLCIIMSLHPSWAKTPNAATGTRSTTKTQGKPQGRGVLRGAKCCNLWSESWKKSLLR